MTPSSESPPEPDEKPRGRPTKRCDLCDEEHDPSAVETLEFGERGVAGDGENWRILRVCIGCREGRLLPVLRRLADGPGINLAEPKPENDADWVLPGPDGTVFSTFETAAGTTHIAGEVRTGPATLFRPVYTAECGIEVPDPHGVDHRIRAIDKEDVCQRCAKSAPTYVK